MVFGEDVDIVPALEQQGFGTWATHFMRLVGSRIRWGEREQVGFPWSVSERLCAKEPLRVVITELSAKFTLPTSIHRALIICHRGLDYCPRHQGWW